MNTESTETKQNERGGRVASDNSELLVSRKPKHDSCVFCKHQWYHQASYGEVVYDGPSGFVCDGNSKGNVANLKSFPFKTSQKCFQGKAL